MLFSATRIPQNQVSESVQMLMQLSPGGPYVAVIVLDAQQERVLEMRLEPVSNIAALMKLYQQPNPIHAE